MEGSRNKLDWRREIVIFSWFADSKRVETAVNDSVYDGVVLQLEFNELNEIGCYLRKNCVLFPRNPGSLSHNIDSNMPMIWSHVYVFKCCYLFQRKDVIWVCVRCTWSRCMKKTEFFIGLHVAVTTTTNSHQQNAIWTFRLIWMLKNVSDGTVSCDYQIDWIAF